MTTETLVRFLWPMIWQSALLAVAVGGVTLLLRERLEPRWRYLLWVVVLVRLALPVLPGSPVGILPAQHPEKTTAVVAVSSPGTAMPPATAFQTPAPSGTEVVQETRAQEIGTRSVSECQETAARSVSDGLLGRLIVFRQFNPSLTFRAAVEMTTRTIFAVWLCGALFFAFKYVSGEIWLQRLCRRVRPPDDETLNTLLDECRREMRIRRRVRLYIVSQEIAAASFGVIFPKILVSERVMRQFSAEALRLVLLHELAHIKRLDSAVHVLTRLITIFHWPNPVLWLTRRRLECEREHACDAAVLHKLERKKHREYGQMVLTFADWYAANHAAKRHASALVGVFPNHDLKRRITMIIKHKPPRWWQTLLGATLLATLTLAGLTTAKPATANPTSGNMSNENTTNRAATEKTENQEKNLLTLHGSVVDENNNPVTGIRIWPAINRWLGDDTPHEPVFTDQNGKFIVSVDEKNAWKWGTIYAISDDKTLSGNYSVSPQEGTRTRWGSDIVITVKKTGLRTISGTVVVADGKPAEGVLVRNTSLIPGDAYATKTDASGAFRLTCPDDLPVGIIYAIDPERGVASLDLRGNYRFVGGIEMVAVEALPDDENNDNDNFAAVAPSAAIISPHDELPESRQRYEDVVCELKLEKFIEEKCRVLDAEGKPIPGCTVETLDLYGLCPYSRTTTDSDGFASFKMIPESKGKTTANILWVEGPKDGITNQTTGKTVYYHEKQESLRKIPLVDNVRTVTLPREARILVTLKNQDGSPVSVVPVYYHLMNPVHSQAIGSYILSSGFDGTATIRVEAGSVLNIDAQSKFGTAPAVLNFEAGDGSEVKKLEMTFGKGTKVSGTIMQYGCHAPGEEIKPLPAIPRDFSISVKGPESTMIEGAYHFQTDAEGKFECILPPGTYHFPGTHVYGKYVPTEVVIPKGMDSMNLEIKQQISPVPVVVSRPH